VLLASQSWRQEGEKEKQTNGVHRSIWKKKRKESKASVSSPRSAAAACWYQKSVVMISSVVSSRNPQLRKEFFALIWKRVMLKKKRRAELQDQSARLIRKVSLIDKVWIDLGEGQELFYHSLMVAPEERKKFVVAALLTYVERERKERVQSQKASLGIQKKRTPPSSNPRKPSARHGRRIRPHNRFGDFRKRGKKGKEGI